MKILFVEQQYLGGTLWGDGVGPFTIDITRQLAKAGHEVHVLSCLVEQEPRDVTIDGVFVHFRRELRIRGAWRLLSLPGIRRVHGVVARRDGEVLRWLRLSLSTYFEFRRLGIDVDVIESSTYPRSTLLLALFRPKPLVLTAHLPGWQPIIQWLGHPAYVDVNESPEAPFGFFQKAGNAVTTFQAKRAAAFTVPSCIVAEAYAHTPVYSSMVADMRVVPFAIWPEPWLSVPDVSSTSHVILQVGGLESRKAPEVLVDAGARLVSDFPDLEIVFVGRSLGTVDGVPYVEWLRKRAADQGSPCRFVGAVKREDLLSWHARARVVAVPSWFDTFPVAGLEALAAGRPVVCTRGVGYADFVEEAKAGAVVAAGDDRDLARHLRRYLQDPGVAGEAGSAGRELVTKGKLSVDATLGNRVAIYEEAIAKSRR